MPAEYIFENKSGLRTGGSPSFMKCLYCHKPVAADAKFCPECGKPTTVNRMDTTAPPDADRFNGLILDGRYELVELLGHGAMGRVYRAKRLAFGDEVAVKLVWPDGAESLSSEARAAHVADYVPRFRREARVAARLKEHPRVVTVYDVNEKGGDNFPPYLVMELVTGVSLETLLQRGLPLATLFALLEDICAGLAAAHELDILHRDLKPANILTYEYHSRHRAKLMDFGLAKVLRPKEGENWPQLTDVGAFIGTPLYAAPEIWRGLDYDERADVYSLGILAYEMLCGQRPFNGATRDEVKAQHLNDAPAPLSGLPGVPLEVCAVVMQALRKDPAERYPDGAAFRSALAQAFLAEKLRAEAEKRQQDEAERAALRDEAERHRQLAESLRRENEVERQAKLSALHLAETEKTKREIAEQMQNRNALNVDISPGASFFHENKKQIRVISLCLIVIFTVITFNSKRGVPNVEVLKEEGQIHINQSNKSTSNVMGFQLSSDAKIIGFAYDPSAKPQVRFNVIRKRKLMFGAESVELAAPLTKSGGLVVTDWLNGEEPKLNGQRLVLNQYEKSQSLAVAQDGSVFLLGTKYWLRLYGRDGSERWKNNILNGVWSVNLSSDGRLAVAALGDGTIRWYRMTDGKELLAFFPHTDQRRWVLWTPGGYYDRSGPDAEDLIGWHVNRGPDQAADFYPAGLFRDTFYRPDKVDAALAEVGE